MAKCACQAGQKRLMNGNSIFFNCLNAVFLLDIFLLYDFLDYSCRTLKEDQVVESVKLSSEPVQRDSGYDVSSRRSARSTADRPVTPPR